MSVQTELLPANPMVMACASELVPAAEYPSVPADRRISLHKLLSKVSATVSPGQPPTIGQLFAAEPAAVEIGMYASPNDPDYNDIESLVRVGVQSKRYNPAGIVAVRNAGGVWVPVHGVTYPTVNYGVVFPATEFKVIARDPDDLAHHVVTQTIRSRLQDPDRAGADAASKRSGAHALRQKLAGLAGQIELYDEELLAYGLVQSDFSRPRKGSRSYAKNAEKRRGLIDEKLHEMIEVSGQRREIKGAALLGVHRAVKRHLYSGNYSAAEFSYNWIRYIRTLAKYTQAKKEKAEISQAKTRQRFDNGYSRYLDRDERRIA